MDKIRLSCPHCGYFREIPAEKIPPTARSVTCPECRRKFSLAEASAPLDEVVQENSSQSWKYWEGLAISRAEAEERLHQAAPAAGFAALLRDGWQVYCRKWEKFSALYLYMLLLAMLPWGGYWQIKTGGIPVPARWQGSLLVLLLTLGLSALGLMLGSCSILQLVVNEKAGFCQALRAGVRSFPGYFGLLLWMIFMVVGGGLLLIPGLLFAGLFSLAAFVLLHEKERGLNALCISAQYVRTSLWPNLGKVSVLLGILVLGTVLLVTQIVVLPYVMVCLYLFYGDARRQVAGQRQLAGPKFKRYFVLPVVSIYVLAAIGAAVLTVRQDSVAKSLVSHLKQMSGELVVDSWKLSGVAPPGCGLVLEQSIVRPGEPIKVRVMPSSKISQNYYLCVADEGGQLGESYVIDQETQRQRLIYVKAPGVRGGYQLKIFSDYDRTVSISSVNFQVN